MAGNFYRFADFEFDILKEVGNIGAGNAATALSKLLDKQVNMQVPNVSLLPFEQMIANLGGPEQVVLAVFLRVVGETSGNLFFIMTPRSAKKLLQSVAGVETEADGTFSDMELSALSEIGNILAGAYLSSLGDFTKLRMAPTVPSATIDMFGAIVSYGLIEYGQMGDHALVIDTKFLEGDHEVEGHLFLIPDPDSFDKLFRALGVPLE